ncbi:MAG TPA: FkbM family methyltransferase [Patescibacteria group bacterium]|nr:FkbM family methyltransferase [Patescibacteria group bacterium]
MKRKKIIKIVRKIIKTTLPLKKRLHFYWRAECIRQAISSKNNIIRDKNSQKTAIKFDNYLKKQNIEEIINNLKRNLDQESQTEIDLFINRQKYIFTHNLIEQGKLYTEQEKEEQILCTREEKLIEKKLRKFKFKHFSIESFYGKNGLRWLPLDKIEGLSNTAFVDIGAYDGDSAISLLEYKPKTIYAFEPEHFNFQKLQNNNKLLEENIIRPVKKGLSSQSFQANITNNDVMSTVNSSGQGENIDVITLDKFAKENSIEKIGLIKIDVEGEERKVLLGSVETIKRDKPTLTISIYHNPKDFFEIKPWLQELVPEYKFIIKKSQPFSLNHELMLLAYI